MNPRRSPSPSGEGWGEGIPVSEASRRGHGGTEAIFPRIPRIGAISIAAGESAFPPLSVANILRAVY